MGPVQSPPATPWRACLVPLALLCLVLLDGLGAGTGLARPLTALVHGGGVVPVLAGADEPLGRPAPPPAGVGGYAFLVTGLRGGPVAFDPCRPVHWVMRPDGAPEGARELLDRGFAELGRATGLVFVHDGDTDEGPPATLRGRPLVQPERYGRRWAPVLVVWSDEREVPELAGPVAGLAGPAVVDPDGTGRRLVTGQVVLDRDSFGAWPDPLGELGVVLHELGHLAGLAHVEDAQEVMNAHGSGRTGGYTPGALRGLAQLGTGSCFSR